MQAESQATVSCMLRSCIGILNLKRQTRYACNMEICIILAQTTGCLTYKNPSWTALMKLNFHFCFMPSENIDEVLSTLLPQPEIWTLPSHDFVW